MGGEEGSCYIPAPRPLFFPCPQCVGGNYGMAYGNDYMYPLGERSVVREKFHVKVHVCMYISIHVHVVRLYRNH